MQYLKLVSDRNETIAQSMTQSTVEIFKGKGYWYLRIESPANNFYRIMRFSKLIEALNTACILQLHVTNVDELPLKQWGSA